MQKASTLHTTESAAPSRAIAKESTRLYFIDHLRAALTILVVLHHIAMVFGASAPFYFVDPPLDEPVAFRDLLVFALVNQGWFMGAFFLLAGYFTPTSFDRKGTGPFLKDRLIRLGIPLIVFTFILGPLSGLGAWLMPVELTGITNPPTWEVYPDLLGIGPLWFVLMLLIFSFGYAAWRLLIKPSRVSNDGPSRLGYGKILVFTIALAVVSFLFRMLIPLGQSTSVIFDFISFPTLAYLPQYLGMFIVGLIAARNDWLRTISNAMGLVGFIAAAAATVILFPLAFSGQLFSLELTEAMQNAMGNGHWQSAVYVAWDSILIVGLSLGLIALFRNVFNVKGWLGTFLSKQSYAVYIIHIPIVVYLTYALTSLDLTNIQKTIVASIIIVPVCYIVAFLIRKLPFVSRVI